eukprot:GHUV01037037.1.p1 GENE.GHUV01037037.1~~GHUV01037037.1.p1  ORF type:complete len:111 (-),score=40.94 GHUV01037037.1:855-1187(-)
MEASTTSTSVSPASYHRVMSVILEAWLHSPTDGQLPVRMYRRYQRYLESVLEVAEDYQEIQDLLARHATLQATNDHLRQHQQESAAEAERIRVELQVCVAYHADQQQLLQ